MNDRATNLTESWPLGPASGIGWRASINRATTIMRHHDDELIPTRASLLQRLKNWQDQSSWRVFFDTYWKLIYGVARKAGLSDAEAQDAVQETMASVAKHLPAFEYDPAIGSFKAWLLNMTRWRIADQVRKRRPLEAQPNNTSTSTATIEKVADPASLDLDAVWEQEWEKNLLDAALAKVKARVEPLTYQVFDFYVNKEWPAEKVAGAFSISVDQVYLAKHRITEMLKAEARRLEKEMT
jgi:RNA polymerase sigma-70 factor (ECF subfamily)